MNKKFITIALSLLFSGLAAPHYLNAQEAEKKPEPAKEEAKDEKKEEAAEDEKDAEKEELAAINAKLAVFKSLEGEWTGEEKIEYNPELRKDDKTEVK